VILELAPGIRAIEIACSFDVSRHVVDPSAVLESADPLTVRSKAPALSPIVSFGPDTAGLVAPPGTPILGWLVRIDIEVLSGSATLRPSPIDELDPIDTDSIEIPEGRRGLVDTVVPARHHHTSVILARNGILRTTRLRVWNFHCFCLIDDGPEVLSSPPWPAFTLTRRWFDAYGKPPDDLASRVRHLRFLQLPEPRLMNWVDGLQALIVPGEGISRALHASGMYEPCTVAVLHRLLQPGRTFVDVGANVGLMSMLASRAVGPEGRVVSFEPSRRECARLAGHLERNSLANVEAHRVALGNRNGTADLRVAALSHGGMSTIEASFAYSSVSEAYAETVPIRRLDDVVAERAIHAVHVMKIDVEGAEWAVIDGARETLVRDRPSLIVEIGGESDPARLQWRTAGEAFLRSLGYVFVAIDAEAGRLVSVRDLSGTAENFLIAQPAVVSALDEQLGVEHWHTPREAPALITDSGDSMPYLSIVLTGRNDDFGSDFNDRLFRAFEFNHRQLAARGITHEFVFIEWSPIQGKPLLAEILADRYSELVSHVLTSYVADAAYHDAFSLNPRLQFQEFIAKNIGIRRARGSFILTTNTDVYLGREVLDFLAQRALEPGVLYRVPRIDLKDGIDSDALDWPVLEDERNYDTVNSIQPPCFTNASGDFLLLDRDSYLMLRGFNEVYRVAKIHMDGNFCIKAYSAGLTLRPLDSPVYHVGLGTLHSQAPLYSSRPQHAPWGDRRWNGAVVYDNHPDWGLWRAPSREVRPGIHHLDFSWDAVPPAVALRRVVLPVARTSKAAAPVRWKVRRPAPTTESPEPLSDPELQRARLDFVHGLALQRDGVRVLEVMGTHDLTGLPDEGVDLVLGFDVLSASADPVAALRPLANLCLGQLVVDAMICDSDRPLMMMADEMAGTDASREAARYRPSPSFIATALCAVGFPFIYAAATPPQHPDFIVEPRHNLDTVRGGRPLRAMFVASRVPLARASLAPLAPGPQAAHTLATATPLRPAP
jgi:FkbM family methyltransferase